MAAPLQCTRLASLLLVAFVLTAAEPGDDLRMAARKGQTQQVASLLTRGAPIDSPDRDGRTALMIAAQRGRAETVKLLLDRGANADARDKQGWTVYALALLNGHDDVVAILPKHEPLRVQVEPAVASENVYSSCSMTPPQLAQEIAALQLDAVVMAALREYASASGKGVIEFVDADPQARIALKIRPSVSCVTQQAADNLTLAIDVKAVRVSDGKSIFDKTIGGGLKGLHAKAATSPAQYAALFAEWAKAHAANLYWSVVEAWLRA